MGLLVIGYGNTLRRDDGVGWAVAQRLIDKLPSELASILMVHLLLPELSQPISRSEQVIFIDASAELPPGEIKRQAILPAFDDSRTIGHQQSPAGILRLAADLYGHCPPATLYSIGGADFSLGCSLSRLVQSAARKVAGEISEAVLAEARI